MSETLIEWLRTYAQWTREALENGPSHPKSIAIDDVDPDMLDQAADALTVAQARIAELERALREARLQLKYLHDKFGVTGSGMGVIAHIDAALGATSPRDAREPRAPSNNSRGRDRSHTP